MAQHDIEGTVRADGSWTRFGVVRQTDGRGSIEFDPGQKAGVCFCMRLRNAADGNVFTDDVCWSGDESGRKTLATNVLAGTRFTVDARGSNGRTAFDGKLLTA